MLKYGIPGLLLLFLVTGLGLMDILFHKSNGRPHTVLLLVLLLASVVLIGWIIYQAMQDERNRVKLSSQLGSSRDKYRALLETSTDGTILVLGEEIVFANFVFMAMSGYTMKEVLGMKISELLETRQSSPDVLAGSSADHGRTSTTEAWIRCKRGDMREVIIAVSGITLEGSGGSILVVKDISGRDRLEKESMDMMNELQSSLLQMNLPVSSIIREHIFCDLDLPVIDAAGIMSRKGEDAIIVMKDNKRPVGIVTDSDLRDRILAEGKDPGSPISEIMSSPITRISEQALLYEAILKVREQGISHLVVEDKNKNITGIFSNDDLLEVQRNSISYLVKEIDAAGSVDALKKIHDKIPMLARILLYSGSKIRNITYMISTVTDAITHRLIEFAIEEMGEPPAEFAFMALGSEGRREQTLVTDQDNAVIFEDVPNERLAEVNRYFLYFGKKINLWLDRIGYRYCPGEVMVGNPQWCQPISKWEKYFGDWINARSEEGLLGIAVFFDFRIVYGMEQFGDELRQQINKSVAGKPLFFQLLAKEAAAYKIPPDLPDLFDVKNALSPLVDMIRVYSVHNQVSETNSMLRLEKLHKYNIIEESDFQEIDTVYNRLMEIRFRSHVNAILNNEIPDNMIRQEELDTVERTFVSKSFSEISRYQARILNDFA